MLVNIHEAKTHLSSLLERVARGDEIIIGRSGKPIAKLVPYQETHEPRTLGGWEGRVWMADDFNELPEEIAAAFRGERE